MPVDKILTLPASRTNVTTPGSTDGLQGTVVCSVPLADLSDARLSRLVRRERARARRNDRAGRERQRDGHARSAGRLLAALHRRASERTNANT